MYPSLGTPAVYGHLILVAKSLYYCSEDCVCVYKAKYQPFSVDVGLHQGCVLSPLPLHSLHQLGRDSNSRVNKDVTVGSCTVNCLRFADNFVLLASSEQDLQHMLGQFSTAFDQARMQH